MMAVGTTLPASSFKLKTLLHNGLCAMTVRCSSCETEGRRMTKSSRLFIIIKGEGEREKRLFPPSLPLSLSLSLSLSV